MKAVKRGRGGRRREVRPRELLAIAIEAATAASRPFAAAPFGKRHCALCGNRVGRFLPYQGGWLMAPPLLRVLECIGSDLDNFMCPRCDCTDRDRHLFLYMKHSGLLAELSGKVVVHFAPEPAISQIISAASPTQYVRCDLFPTSPDIRREDLLRTSFDSGSVDLLIANHVLEHVGDDRAALAEIARVLRPGGFAILQTPFSPVLERTWEDAGVRSEQARTQAFGQKDHVRLYGRDIFERLSEGPLEPRIQTHAEALPNVDAKSAGVNAREPFFLFTRSAIWGA